MKFAEYKSGLYYYDASKDNAPAESNNTSATVEAYLFLNTVAGNKAAYPQHKIEGADKARALYRKLGHPSEHEFNNILNNNMIRNCPITPDDAKRALNIYGPDIMTLKGKTAKSRTRPYPQLPTGTHSGAYHRKIQNNTVVHGHLLGQRTPLLKSSKRLAY